MSYRKPYLVCYDISDARRLQRVHRYLLGYKVGGQKSFFECWLTPPELQQMRRRLTALIDPGQDRVHLFQLDPRMTPEVFGVAKTKAPDEPFMIF